jgi:hypothetical protein
MNILEDGLKVVSEVEKSDCHRDKNECEKGMKE